MINVLDHPILLENPKRLTPASCWVEHTPFAMFVIDVLRPKTFVELGTHYGESYCAFCQAVEALKTGTQCYAVDTWQGDPNIPNYDAHVLANLRLHHDPLYSDFSTLLPMTFDAATEQFDDGSLDLLHIDGFHAYEAVKNDSETWLPKMSQRGVILFHDTCVERDDFGVKQLWEEISRRYPHFNFLHGHGLGVLAVGPEQPEAFQKLLRASESERSQIRRLFSFLGEKVAYRSRIIALEEKAQYLEQHIRLIDNSRSGVVVRRLRRIYRTVVPQRG